MAIEPRNEFVELLDGPQRTRLPVPHQVVNLPGRIAKFPILAGDIEIPRR
jgi:hypothetical protein